VDNSIDESLAGHCDDIVVTIHTDNSISVVDNGRGIRTGVKMDKHEPKRSAAEIDRAACRRQFNQNSYKVSGGLHGVGVSCVNALSKMLRLTIRRDGKVREFSKVSCKTARGNRGRRRGVAHEGDGETDKRGTEVLSAGHRHLQGKQRLSLRDPEQRLRELSFLNNGKIR
jgi:DNA gyrase subunit B